MAHLVSPVLNAAAYSCGTPALVGNGFYIAGQGRCATILYCVQRFGLRPELRLPGREAVLGQKERQDVHLLLACQTSRIVLGHRDEHALDEVTKGPAIPLRRELAADQGWRRFGAAPFEIFRMAAHAVLGVQRFPALALRFGVDAVPLRFRHLRPDSAHGSCGQPCHDGQPEYGPHITSQAHVNCRLIHEDVLRLLPGRGEFDPNRISAASVYDASCLL